MKRKGLTHKAQIWLHQIVQNSPEESHFRETTPDGRRNSFVICNLSHEEIDLEDNIDTSLRVEANNYQQGQLDKTADVSVHQTPPRTRRSSRKEINYKHLNEFGFQEEGGGEKKKKPR